MGERPRTSSRVIWKSGATSSISSSAQRFKGQLLHPFFCFVEIYLGCSSLSTDMSLLALELKLAREDLGHIIKKETKSVTRLLLENHYLDVYKKRSEPSPRRKKKRPRWLIHRIYLYWPSLKFVKDKLPCISSLSRNHKKTERKDTAIIFFFLFLVICRGIKAIHLFPSFSEEIPRHIRANPTNGRL